MENLPNPMAKKNAEGRVEICPQRPSACDEFQLVIPWRVALQQSPPLLHQPLGSMRYSSLARLEFFSERHSVSYSLVSPEGSTSPGEAFDTCSSQTLGFEPTFFRSSLNVTGFRSS